MKNTLLEKLLQSTIIAGFAFTGVTVSAYAQTADTPVELINTTDVEEEEEGDVIVVTGSRMKKTSFSSVSPLQVVDGETARDLGLVNAQDILSNTTVVSGQQNTVGISTAFNGGLQQAFTTIGNVSPSLRGLGSSVTGRARSLVLINGRRFGPIGVGGAPANTDISMIPGSLIERTEILLDGASSVYGSDAIAGVVNYIMRSDFDGVELALTNQMGEHGWGQSTIGSVTMGVNNDRGFLGFAAEYNFSEEIENREVLRDIVGTTDGQLCDVSIGVLPDGSQVRKCDGFAGRFNIVAGLGTVISHDSGGRYAQVPGTDFFLRPGNFFRPGNDPDIHGFAGDFGDSYLPEVSRFTMFTTGEYDLYNGHTFFMEGMYSSRQLEAQSSGQEVLAYTAATPFNPFGAPGLLVIPQLNDVRQEIDLFRMVAGMRGDANILGDSWTYETFISAHRSNGFQRRGGFFLEEHLVAGLAGTTDAFGNVTCTTPSGPSFFGLAQSRSPVACIPLNPFTAGFMETGRFDTQQENDFAYGGAVVQTEVEQIIAGGFVTGDIYNFKQGGTAQLLLGAEYRTDQVKTTPGDNLRLGLLAGVDADAGSTGERWIRELFTELSLPLLEDQPFAKSLSIEGALRWTEEQFAGSDITYQVKGEWAPNDWLSFQGGYGTSFRAPDTGEQFGTGTVFVVTSRADPCIVSGFMIDRTGGINTYDASLDTRSATLLANCRALGLDPTTLGSVGQGTAGLAFTTTPVAFGNFGNIATSPETSKAFFAGFTADQPWFDQFDLSLKATYFDYEVEGSIGQLTRGQILSDCFESVGLSDPLCAFQTRDPNGILVAVNEASINLGPTTSRGYDVNMRFGYEITQLGLDDSIDLDWNLLFTQSLENKEDVLNDGNPNDNLGDLTFAGGFPDYQAVSTVRLGYKDVGVTWRARFVSDLIDSPDTSGSDLDVCNTTPGATPIPGCIEKEFVGHYWQHDLFATYRADTWVFRGGVTNVFDKMDLIDGNVGLANVCVSCGHDIFGRRFTLSVQKSF